MMKDVQNSHTIRRTAPTKYRVVNSRIWAIGLVSAILIWAPACVVKQEAQPTPQHAGDVPKTNADSAPQEETALKQKETVKQANGSSETETTQAENNPETDLDESATLIEEEDALEDGPSPWGETREEKCKQKERPTIRSRAKKSIEQGISAANQGKKADATRAFQRALSEDSKAYIAAYNLGIMYDRQGQKGQAMGFYRKALEVVPDYEDAVRGITSVYLRRGGLQKAIQFVENIADRYPSNLHLQSHLAELYAENENFDGAWKAARKALQCDERFPPALTALVKAGFAQGRSELAESILEQALSVDPENAELNYLKGKMLEGKVGRLKSALDAYKKAVASDPSHLAAQIALGRLLLGGGNYQEAKQHFETALSLAPDSIEVHLNLGDTYRSLKQWEQALKMLNQAQQMQSDLASVYFNLALLYLEGGESIPGFDKLSALQKAKEQFTLYRDMLGSKLKKKESSASYLEDIERRIDREQRRIERAKAREQRNKERAARAAQMKAEEEAEAADENTGADDSTTAESTHQEEGNEDSSEEADEGTQEESVESTEEF